MLFCDDYMKSAIAEVKQRKGWLLVSHQKLPRAPLCFGKHGRPLIPAAFAVVRTHQSVLDPRGGL
jgi:hypothetical protein